MTQDDRRGWLEEMKADLGEEAAERLCALAGGQRHYIPRGGGWLSRDLGEAAALWLSARFGGEYLQIPLLETLRQIDCRRRMQAVAEAEGVNANELAQRLGVHRRTIQRMRQALRTQTAEGSASSRPAVDPRQMDLFDPPAEEGSGPRSKAPSPRPDPSDIRRTPDR